MLKINYAVVLLLAVTLMGSAHAYLEDSCPGHNFRAKDELLSDKLEAQVNRVYRDFETLNYDDLASMLDEEIHLCARARFDLGCYDGIPNVISYVSLIKTEESELLKLWSMKPVTPIYVDVIKRSATTTAQWDFFSYPAHKNVTLYMKDTFEFTCEDKLKFYSSWGDASEWVNADIPPMSDHNATRICLGNGHLGGIQATCPVGSADQQFPNDAACISFISGLEPEVAAPFGHGNSIGCRDWHLGLARFAPDIHCPHVGPTGGGKCI